MQSKQQNEKFTVIVGLGHTGYSCARFLAKQNAHFAVVDSREQPPFLLAMKQHYPNIHLSLGGFDEELIASADELIVSPGVALNTPCIVKAQKNGVAIISDIDLFCQAIHAPIVAITGSNGKSTVTALFGEMAKAQGLKTAVGGNIGTPVLDLLDEHDIYVLELSSFQLENTHYLKPKVAVLLNLSADHMDRYPDIETYQAAKQHIFEQCDIAVFNRNDALTIPSYLPKENTISFGLDAPQKNEFGLVKKDGKTWIARSDDLLMPIDQFKLCGLHNVANILAALTMGHAIGFSLDIMLKVAKEFSGLKHRCQKILSLKQVVFINDSKGTNVGATVAAIEGIAPTIKGKIILIAGGDTKRQDFAPLIKPVKQFVRHLILLGADTSLLETVFDGVVPYTITKTMNEAVNSASLISCEGDAVLLSPACASFDLFKDYQDRGQQFVDAVEKLQTVTGGFNE